MQPTAEPNGGPRSSDESGDEFEAGAVGMLADAAATGNDSSGIEDRADASRADSGTPAADGAPTAWPDDAAESAFLAEARERGETVAPAKAREEIAEETDAKALPPLQELVEKIPAEVRETLEELFRARFTTVKRVPKKALKR